MSGYVQLKDVRSKKTEKALNVAMFSLLEKRNFGKITVSDICEKALISRATFYTRFLDKYDFLESWLKWLKPENLDLDDPYEKLEKAVNHFIKKYASVIKNLIFDANDETMGILFDAILFYMNLEANEKTYPQKRVLSIFLAGGMQSYLQWQVKHKFPPNTAFMNIHIYDILISFRQKQEDHQNE